MSHKELIKRLTEFCNKLEEGSEERLQYLFFIASIAEDDSHDLQDMDFYQVTLELIKHHHAFLRFNKSLMQRQMTKNQMYRRLSRKGVQAPDKIKHVALSEERIMTLLRLSEPMKKLNDEYIEEKSKRDCEGVKEQVIPLDEDEYQEQENQNEQKIDKLVEGL